MQEKDKTPAAAHPRRADAALAPLGTRLLAKALGLTVDEAAQLRADLSDTHAKLGTLGMAREYAAMLLEDV